MSEQEMSFIGRCLAGAILDPGEQIHDAIDAWHGGEGRGQELHAWLGMSWEEYALWAEKPFALRAILAARHMNARLGDMLKVTEGGTALAARGVPAEEFAQIQQWLKQTKRL